MTYWLNIAIFSYPCLIWHHRSLVAMFPLKFRGEVNHEETSHGAIAYPPMKTHHCSILTHCQHVTDSQTDRETDLL